MYPRAANLKRLRTEDVKRTSERVDFSRNAAVYDLRHGGAIGDDVAAKLVKLGSLTAQSRVLDVGAGTAGWRFRSPCGIAASSASTSPTRCLRSCGPRPLACGFQRS